MLAMPRFGDGAIDMQELLGRLTEQVVCMLVDRWSFSTLPERLRRHLFERSICELIVDYEQVGRGGDDVEFNLDE